MITLRKATIHDLDTIRNIAEGTWFITYSEILSPEQADYMFEKMYSTEAILQQISEQNHVFFIAYQKHKPLGYVSIEQQQENIFHLHKLYILPEGQNKGLGKILINKAFDFAKETSQGQKCAMELNVNRNNKALSFYKKMGMYIHGEGDFDIGNGYFMNDYILRIDFEDETLL